MLSALYHGGIAASVTLSLNVGMTWYSVITNGNRGSDMELLTVQETARLLKVAPITIRRSIANGRLPAVTVGRAVRVQSGQLLIERI